MDFSPHSQIFLISNIQLDNSYENTIDFANISEQEQYFKGKANTPIQTNEYTFIRKDSTIKIQRNIESLWGVNYLMYLNKNKWVYCFITDKRYINDNNTELLIETDVMQTYQFDYSLEHSFVEREHQNRWFGVNDPIYNVVTENLTIGDEYQKTKEITIRESEKYFLAVATESLAGAGTDFANAEMIQGYPTPFHYYVIPFNPPIGEIGVQEFCRFLSDRKTIISVSLLNFLPVSLASLNRELVKYGTGGSVERYIRKIRQVHNVPSEITLNSSPINKLEGLNLPTGFGVGVAKHYKYESKLLTHPYTYNLLTDYQAKPMILKNEYLDGNNINFKCVQALSHIPKTKYYVSSGYNNEVNGKSYSMVNDTVNDLPLINDSYLNYLQTQKASVTTGLALAVAGGVIGGASMVATGGVSAIAGGGLLLSSGGKIAMELAKQKDLQNTPDSVRHQGNNIAFDIVDNNTSVKFVRFSVHHKIMILLGDYFHMYGYKCMEVKKPNLRSRYYFNYIKTIGANIKGNMDNKDLVKIKTIYDKGITIWHNRSGVEMLNYSFDNVEMSLI